MDVTASVSDIFRQILIVFSLALFGIVARKTGAIKEETRSSFAAIIMHITLPPLVFVSMISNVTWEQLISGMILPSVSLIVILIAIVASLVLGKLIPMAPHRLRTFSVLCAMPNTSFIAYPVILSVLGQRGLAYAILYDIGATVALLTIVIFVLQGGTAEEGSWKSFINPSLIAMISGLTLNKMGIRIPEPVLIPLKTMGNATVPLAMLLMGYMLGSCRFRVETINAELGAVCVCKLLLYPLIAYFLVSRFSLHPMIRTVIIMQAAMPSMASTPAFVERYGGDGEFAATAVFATTLLSVGTIPAMVYLLI